MFMQYGEECSGTSLATQIIIDEFKVDAIINAGVAGGMDNRLRIFDTVISTEVAYHDVDTGILTEYHPWMKSAFFAADEKLLKTARDVAERIQTKEKVYFGRMVTGEAFISDVVLYPDSGNVRFLTGGMQKSFKLDSEVNYLDGE